MVRNLTIYLLLIVLTDFMSFGNFLYSCVPLNIIFPYYIIYILIIILLVFGFLKLFLLLLTPFLLNKFQVYVFG